MALDSKPDIEVTISPALRGLWAAKDGMDMSLALAGCDAALPTERHLHGRGQPLPYMKELVLRRDGQRPMRIQAALLTRFAGKLPIQTAIWDLVASVYGDGNERAYLSLSLTPPHGTSDRPVHRAREMGRDANHPLMQAMLHEAECDILQSLPVNLHETVRSSIREEFQRITSNCFRPEAVFT